MARSSMMVASVLVVLLAVAHGAEMKASVTFNRRLSSARRAGQAPPAAADEGPQLEPITSAIPDSVSGFDIAALQPLMKLLDPKVIDQKLVAELAALAPQFQVEWLKAVLPYVTDLNPEQLGILARAMFPLLKQIPNTSMLIYIKLIKEINVDTVLALGPALTQLDLGVVARLVDTVNAMSPDLVVNLANVAASINGPTWDALIKLVELGVPAINLAGSKLSMIPITVPAPSAYTGSHFKLPFGH